MNSSFHIIAVRVLRGCKPHIRKILKEDTTYFFKNEYEYDDETNTIRKKNDIKGIPDSFFDMCPKGISGLNINISAIVGKNGDGKSSLVELIIRILNNFAYVSGFKQTARDLLPIEGVYGVLFYSVEDKIFSIECRNDKVIFRPSNYLDDVITNSPIEFSLYNPKDSIDDFVKENASVLFYTFITNYSLYAYNSKELYVENINNEKCWINGIFHKNDGYQTPIVLNPLRTDGNIDVNIENLLSKQRLMAMFVDGSITEINKNEVPQGFAYKLEYESKLFKKTMGEYFKSSMEHNNLSILPLEIENVYNNDLPRFLKKIQSGSNKYKFLFEEAKKIITQLFKDSENNSDTTSSDLRTFLYKSRNSNSSNAEIIDSFTEAGYDCLNFQQLNRVLHIIDTCELWNQICNNFKLPEISFKSDDIYDWSFLCKCYILYKVIDVLEKYEIQYYPYINIKDNSLFSNALYQKWIKEHNVEYLTQSFSIKLIIKLWNLMEDITKQKSHKTLKIRQTLNFWKTNTNHPYLNIEHDFDIDKEMILDITNLDKNFRHYVSFPVYQKRIKDLLKTDKLLIELLPPPIFSIEIIIQKETQPVLFSSLSSGERQLLNVISGIMYHLRNIDSSIETYNTIGYKFVNMILEEIELYFHPEFQQKFILILLSILSKMKFKRLEAINISFVTHSPYILSDIPKNNVLFLENGKPAFPMQEDTFGSNIHTLLHNGFFLSNIPIGMFAKYKINTLFSKLHKGEASKEIHDEILLVSEPILRAQLIKLYKQNLDLMGSEIEILRTEIEMLKKQIKDKQ